MARFQLSTQILLPLRAGQFPPPSPSTLVSLNPNVTPLPYYKPPVWCLLKPGPQGLVFIFSPISPYPRAVVDPHFSDLQPLLTLHQMGSYYTNPAPLVLC
jgi:hypothetical protein